MNYVENKINNLQEENESMKQLIMKLKVEISDLKKYNGISLRDHFAGLAMQSLAALDAVRHSTYQDDVKDYYLLADAMLIERDKLHA